MGVQQRLVRRAAAGAVRGLEMSRRRRMPACREGPSTRLTMKSGAAMRAPSSMSSWAGLPSSTPAAQSRVQDHAVVEGDGALAGHARHQALPAAAVARDHVEDDLAGDDDAVALPDAAVDLHRVAEAGGAECDQLARVEGVVVEHGQAAEHGVADDAPLLLLRLLAVRAEREDHQDVAVRNAGAVERIDDGRQHEVRAGEARDVVDDDRDGLARPHNLLERRGADGAAQGFADGLGLIRRRSRLRAAGSGRPRERPVRTRARYGSENIDI